MALERGGPCVFGRPREEPPSSWAKKAGHGQPVGGRVIFSHVGSAPDLGGC